jgi:hypothetical protein
MLIVALCRSSPTTSENSLRPPPEEVVGNRFDWARPVVLPALIAILGPQGSRWRTESRPRPDRPGSFQTWIHLTEPAEPVNQPTQPEDCSD